MPISKYLDTFMNSILLRTDQSDQIGLVYTYSSCSVTPSLSGGVTTLEVDEYTEHDRIGVKNLFSFMAAFDKKISHSRPASNPNSITSRLNIEIETDLADLYDFYHYCRKHNREFFKNMSIQAFKNWNDRRIAAESVQPAKETTEQAAQRLFRRGGQMLWNNLTRQSEAARWDKGRGQAVHKESDCKCAICVC